MCTMNENVGGNIILKSGLLMVLKVFTRNCHNYTWV